MATATAETLTAMGVRAETAKAWAPVLQKILARHGIDTPRQVAAFLANCAVESGRFERLEENLNYKVAALTALFGPHRITPEQAAKFGRVDPPGPAQPARQEDIANTIYGGPWGARNLGNTRPGDGWRFRGRGLFQLTGRANYERYALASGKTPEEVIALLSDREGAADSAADFFVKNAIGTLADADDIAGVRRAINGGAIGLEEVKVYYAKAKAALGTA